jgi:phosphoribosylcarboxyaminoimidazole (NCAIR) mutase
MRRQIEELAKRIFLILEKAWQLQDGRLVDFKLEFGIDSDGNLLLSDVVDADSWRVIRNGGYFDKQIYREGATPDEYAVKLAATAEITSLFKVPKQQIILWRGSDKDDLEPFGRGYLPFLHSDVPMVYHTRSMHKEPVLGYQELHSKIQEVPDTVIIDYVGKSNGAGPMISANCTVPVINVPQSFKVFPDDVWSSLRTPSDVSCSTILEPANAVQEAMKILAMRNPLLYMILRYEQEKRLVNVIPAF